MLSIILNWELESIFCISTEFKCSYYNYLFSILSFMNESEIYRVSFTMHFSAKLTSSRCSVSWGAVQKLESKKIGEKCVEIKVEERLLAILTNGPSTHL